MVRRNTRAVGRQAEQLAGRFLNRQGLTTVTRNFRSRLGEIDLVLQDGSCLVFAEVRYRSGKRLTPAMLTVDTRKQNKLIRTAALFLAQRPRFANSPVRFDVVAIEADDRCGNSIEWIRDAFRPADSSL